MKIQFYEIIIHRLSELVVHHNCKESESWRITEMSTRKSEHQRSPKKPVRKQKLENGSQSGFLFLRMFWKGSFICLLLFHVIVNSWFCFWERKKVNLVGYENLAGHSLFIKWGKLIQTFHSRVSWRINYHLLHGFFS